MTLSVHIDPDACLAHGDCAALAPGVFAVADIAEIVGPASDAQLRAAARACPAGAIVLLDPTTGDEVAR